VIGEDGARISEAARNSGEQVLTVERHGASKTVRVSLDAVNLRPGSACSLFKNIDALRTGGANGQSIAVD